MMPPAHLNSQKAHGFPSHSLIIGHLTLLLCLSVQSTIDSTANFLLFGIRNMEGKRWIFFVNISINIILNNAVKNCF